LARAAHSKQNVDGTHHKPIDTFMDMNQYFIGCSVTLLPLGALFSDRASVDWHHISILLTG
jgi:hypothetical protein